MGFGLKNRLKKVVQNPTSILIEHTSGQVPKEIPIICAYCISNANYIVVSL